MRWLLSKRMWAVLILALAAGLLRGDPVEEARAKRFADLIQHLGDDDFASRQRAMEELASLGEEALPALRRAASGPDPEIRWRAQQALRSVLLVSKSTGLEFALIAPGEFEMGSPELELGHKSGETMHDVRISRSFLLGKYEVTQDQYEQLMKTNPSGFCARGSDADKVKGLKTGRFPVEYVTWFDAVEFCNKLSGLDGHPAYYRMEEVVRVASSIKRASVTIVGGTGYRLPTEAEWEYACRAGTNTPFYFGIENTGAEANIKPVIIPGGYGGTSKWRNLGRPTSVGDYAPNRWGLFDMHGNVAEWCWDWHDNEYYGLSPYRDPTGPATGNHRVLRGGSWLLNEDGCRSASRFWRAPGEISYYAGFRVARDLP